MRTKGLLALFGALFGMVVTGTLIMFQANSAPKSQVVAAESSSGTGITVIGEGQATGQPDIAYISVGVQTNGTTAQDAQAKNASAMDSVIAKMESLGFKKSDLSTSGLSLYPVSSKPGEISGYTAHNNLTITLTDLDKAGSILDAAIGAGANTSSNIRFAIKDDSALRAQALANAVKSAKPKADAIASGLGMTIKGVTNVTEDISSSTVPISFDTMRAASAPSTPVIPGDLTVTARVKITYSY